MTDETKAESWFDMKVQEATDSMIAGSMTFPKIPIVRLDTYTTPYEVFHACQRIDWDKRHMWTRLDHVPRDAKLAGAGGGYWRWAHTPSHGQILFVPDPNVQIIFDPDYRGGVMVGVELGCDHQFVTVRTANCYTERRCDKCGYHWAVDSSD